MVAEMAAKMASATNVNTMAQLIDGILEGMPIPMNKGMAWKKEQEVCEVIAMTEVRRSTHIVLYTIVHRQQQ